MVDEHFCGMKNTLDTQRDQFEAFRQEETTQQDLFQKELRNNRCNINRFRKEAERQSVNSRREEKKEKRKLELGMQDIHRILKQIAGNMAGLPEKVSQLHPKDEYIEMFNGLSERMEKYKSLDDTMVDIKNILAPKIAVFMKLEGLFSDKLIDFTKILEFIKSYSLERRNIVIARVYVDEDFYHHLENRDLANEMQKAGFEIREVKEKVDIGILNDGFDLPENIEELYLLSGNKFFSGLLRYLITQKSTDCYVVYPKRSHSLDKDLCDSCTKVIDLHIDDFRLVAPKA